jgi:ComF family protein
VPILLAARLACRPIPSALARAADGALLVLLAPRCQVCDTLLGRLRGGPVCAACWHSVRTFTPPLCDGCGGPLGWSEAVRCGHCAGRVLAVDRAAAVGPYEGALREIIHVLKYRRRRSVARPLAALMRKGGRDILAGADAVVPVPLHWRKLQARGFNQAADLAAGLGLPVCRALRRAKPTRSQIELPAAERRRNVQRAFVLAGTASRRWRETRWRRALEGQCVVLVDDVSTTGATLEACASVLKAAGAREVRALTAARTVTTRR